MGYLSASAGQFSRVSIHKQLTIHSSSCSVHNRIISALKSHIAPFFFQMPDGIRAKFMMCFTLIPGIDKRALASFIDTQTIGIEGKQTVPE